MRTYVTGDIHNNYKALIECIDKSNINVNDDRLIVLGDICDGNGPYTNKVIDILLDFDNLILIRGNHDEWFIDWVNTGVELPIWWHQGGIYSAQSYDFNRNNVNEKHKNLVESSVIYYIDDNNNIFMHGGFDPSYPIMIQSQEDIMWDRNLLFHNYRNEKCLKYNNIFVGHTSSQFVTCDVNNHEPMFRGNVIGIDTGAGTYPGVLTFMNVETLEFVQSGSYKY